VRWCRIIRTLSLACLIVLVVLAVALVADGLIDNVETSDVAIVLGSHVMPDGAPSPRLRARLDRAAELYQRGFVKHVIVSGGTGQEGYSEARVMADYLATQKAVPRELIVLDETGSNTRATARNSAALMAERSMRSAVVVTRYFHITRSRWALKRAGIQAITSAHAHFFEMRDIYSVAREVIALPVYLLRSAIVDQS
jgi:vancomycin permeability regulator SanA